MRSAPVTVLAADAAEAAHAVRGLRSVAFLDVAGYVLGGGPEVTRSGRRSTSSRA